MDVEQLRAWLPVTRDAIYMNTGWAGPTPTPVLQRMREVQEQEATLGPASARGQALARETAEGARQAIGTLLNAPAQDVVLTHSTTEGMNVVLHGLDWRPGDELVTCSLEHPAVNVPAAVLSERRGVRVQNVHLAPDASAGEVLEAVTSAMTARTRIVALSHVQYTCGLRMPMRDIAAAAHSRGILVLIDGAQGAGHVDVDVQDLDCDFYAASGQKWLLGPVGTGALYVSREQQAGIQPIFTTHAIEESRGYRRPALARFAVASQSPALLAGLAAAAGLWTGVGMGTAEARATALADRLRQAAGANGGCTVLGPSAGIAATALVTVAIEGWRPEAAVAALQERFGIVARAVSHPDGVRFSTAYFNTEDEVDRVGQALEQLVREHPGDER